MANEVLDVIYDGQCGFCARSLALCRRLARRPVFRLHEANDQSLTSQFPGLVGADTENAMFALTARGEVFRGFFAFRRMMWASPWLYPLLPLFYLPGASRIGPRLYAWVARHRRSLGCAPTCVLPEQPPRRRL